MNRIKSYMIDELNMTEITSQRIISKLKRHPDIADELSYWIENRVYESPVPVVVEGYTASDVYKLAPFMNGVGVYSFMIALREQPEIAKQQIKAGFPRK